MKTNWKQTFIGPESSINRNISTDLTAHKDIFLISILSLCLFWSCSGFELSVQEDEFGIGYKSCQIPVQARWDEPVWLCCLSTGAITSHAVKFGLVGRSLGQQLSQSLLHLKHLILQGTAQPDCQSIHYLQAQVRWSFCCPGLHTLNLIKICGKSDLLAGVKNDK